MGRRGRGLASRLKIAHQQHRAEQARTETEAQRQRAAAAAARDELLAELMAFAKDTGFLEARLSEGRLALHFGDRALAFEPVGEADVIEITWAGQPEGRTDALHYEAQLGRWVLSVKRRRREDRILFWDEGLEALLVDGLGVPDPGESEPATAAETDLESRDRRL